MKSRVLTAFLLVAGLLCGAAPVLAQERVDALQAPLALNFDLDGEAADADQVVTTVLLADSATHTVAADPDACRLVDATVTDANSSVTVGTLTIVGFDCYGQPLTVTFNLAGGSGVRTGAVTAGRASGAYFSDVTSVTNGVLTGEDGVADAIIVGYTANSVQGWPMYGRLVSSATGRRWVDPFGSWPVSIRVKNGSATTDITTVTASQGPFQNVLAGDLLYLNVGGETVIRRVVTRTDANNIIVNSGVTLPTTGIGFSYKRLYYSTDPQDGWFSVDGFDAVSTVVQVDANANTGGVISSIECATLTADGAAVPDVVFEVDTATVASAAVGTDTTTVDLRLTPHYTHCRAGVKFGTGDDADAAAENIDIVVGLRR